MSFTKSFFGETTTDRPSKATGSSIHSMRFSAQVVASAERIGREASETSVSSLQNFLKPPPVPEMPTVTRTLPPVAFWNSSAIASETGKTVDEPSTLIVPVSVFRSATFGGSRPAGFAAAAGAVVAAGAAAGLVGSAGFGASVGLAAGATAGAVVFVGAVAGAAA